jgi:hypothetical protein
MCVNDPISDYFGFRSYKDVFVFAVADGREYAAGAGRIGESSSKNIFLSLLIYIHVLVHSIYPLTFCFQFFSLTNHQLIPAAKRAVRAVLAAIHKSFEKKTECHLSDDERDPDSDYEFSDDDSPKEDSLNFSVDESGSKQADDSESKAESVEMNGLQAIFSIVKAIASAHCAIANMNVFKHLQVIPPSLRPESRSF